MALCPPCAGQAADDGEIWSRGELAAAVSALAHPHIPRRRKSMRPQRALSGSASPRTAPRSTSYWSAMADDEHADVAAMFTGRFFLAPARSFWGEIGRASCRERWWVAGGTV